MSPVRRRRGPTPRRSQARPPGAVVAKHARWDGGLHPDDGTHAVYHREMRAGAGGDRRRAWWWPTTTGCCSTSRWCDFVFPLLNRGGFLNSEMLLPLLCQRLGLPYLGATPYPARPGRRQAPDQARGRGARPAHRALGHLPPAARRSKRRLPGRRAVRDQAQRQSSASWGVSDAHDWMGVRQRRPPAARRGATTPSSSRSSPGTISRSR